MTSGPRRSWQRSARTGKVWVIDWYNFIVQHNPTPAGYKTGKGAAYETPLRDKTRGRIYRIVAKDGKPSERPRLSQNDPAGLVSALKNDNMFWRLHAQRLLVERGQDDVAEDLAKLVADPSVDAVGLNPGAIHAMWTLRRSKAGRGPASPARPRSRRPSIIVRRVCVATRRSPCRRISWPRMTPAGALLDDPEPLVRLAALLRIADLAQANGDTLVLANQIASGGFDRDRGLVDAATSAAARHDVKILDYLTRHKSSDHRRLRRSRSFPAWPNTTPGRAGRLDRHHDVGRPRGRPLGQSGDHRRVRQGLAEGQAPKLGAEPGRPSPPFCRSSRPTPAAGCSASPRAGASGGWTNTPHSSPGTSSPLRPIQPSPRRPASTLPGN